MGHPKKQRIKYSRPKKPLNKQRIERERKLVQEFGLKRKRELWKAESILRNFRRRARELQAKRNEKKEHELFKKLNELGLKCAKLDDILEITVKDLLSRRLQTIVYKKGIANSSKHARQLIVHGHITVNSRKVFWPNYIVPSELEKQIDLNPAIKGRLLEEEKEGKEKV